MSSFKRRAPASKPSSSSSSSSTSAPPPPGTRPSPALSSTLITSTGLPSLDDVLGGGLPLSCSFLALAPDAHSAYGELVVRYFAAQGLASGQRVCVVEGAEGTEDGRRWAEGCMWMPGVNAGVREGGEKDDDEEGGGKEEDEEKVKIAWRYEGMRKFQTTVANAYVRSFPIHRYDHSRNTNASQIQRPG